MYKIKVKYRLCKMLDHGVLWSGRHEIRGVYFAEKPPGWGGGESVNEIIQYLEFLEIWPLNWAIWCLIKVEVVFHSPYAPVFQKSFPPPEGGGEGILQYIHPWFFCVSRIRVSQTTGKLDGKLKIKYKLYSILLL